MASLIDAVYYGGLMVFGAFLYIKFHGRDKK
jgi:hypothetical protein